ncbi:hypothetical protein HOY82DRAFT_632387 [Tuber indicum]|nr:hypothetical protein HOY82DRAFT_632387 [Tuber indicum]
MSCKFAGRIPSISLAQHKREIKKEIEKLDERWYVRVQKLNQTIASLQSLALAERTEKLKIEENFNLRSALERINFQVHLQGISKPPMGVKSALCFLADTAKFKEILAEEVQTRHLVSEQVINCIPQLYHKVSQQAHENNRMILINETKYPPIERAALVIFMRLQNTWPAPLTWREQLRDLNDE